MEQATHKKTIKHKTSSVSTVGLRVRRETKKRIQTELAKINKKDFGKKVRCDELIGTALSLLAEHHFKKLQEESMTNTDKFEQQYAEYSKKNANTTRDEYLGILMRESAENKLIKSS